MDTIKKILGFFSMLGGLALTIGLPYLMITKLGAPEAKQEDYVFWIVVTIIFTPICIGFILFGYFGVKGEYDGLIKT